jgi:DNA-binding PadR family transcriptional regulator
LVRECDLVLDKGALRRLVLRILTNRELSGYEVWKELGAKGVKIRTNYLYMVLAEMHSRELLKGRWVESRRGPRRHLHTLSRKGEDELRNLLAESMEFVAAAFTQANMTAGNLHEHVSSVRASFASMGAPTPGSGKRLVLTTPALDPLVCFPLSYQAFGEAFPTASVTVVKPPGATFTVDAPNVTFVDGSRCNMPMKDGYADYLLLEGFPADAPVDVTLAECYRVLKDGGYLIIRLPSVMTEEKKPNFSNLAEFAMRLYYDFTGQDAMVSVERVKRLISRRCGTLTDRVDRGNVVICAKVSKRDELPPVRAIRRA